MKQIETSQAKPRYKAYIEFPDGKMIPVLPRSKKTACFTKLQAASKACQRAARGGPARAIVVPADGRRIGEPGFWSDAYMVAL